MSSIPERLRTLARKYEELPEDVDSTEIEDTLATLESDFADATPEPDEEDEESEEEEEEEDEESEQEDKE